MAKKSSTSSSSDRSRTAKSNSRAKSSSSKSGTKKAGSRKPATGSGKKKTTTKKKPASKAARKPSAKIFRKPAAKPAAKSTRKPGAKPAGRPATRTGDKAPSSSRKGRSKATELIYLDHTSEDLFASQLLEELEYRHGVDVATIDVRIRDGMAVARGSVSDLEELEAVRETMQDAGGITDLTFVIQVAPDRRDADRDRARQIQEVLDAESDLAGENILVACVGRKAVVRGTVTTRMRKLKAGLLALRKGEVGRVANRLVVLRSTR